MIRRLRKLFWKLVPHRCVWLGFTSKYGGCVWCEKCGRSQTFMDVFPWGD
jgi:hypothetical protein